MLNNIEIRTQYRQNVKHHGSMIPKLNQLNYLNPRLANIFTDKNIIKKAVFLA